MPEVVPSVPPLRALGKVISDNVLVRAILFPLVPGVRAVMVTAAPLELAVTPSAVGQAAIAAARFVAWIVVLEFSPKVPVKVGAVPVQAFAAPGLIVTQFNGPTAGQTVFHLHFHIVPVYVAGGLRPHARVKAEPAILEAHAARIRAALAAG